VLDTEYYVNFMTAPFPSQKKETNRAGNKENLENAEQADLSLQSVDYALIMIY